jgi:hypothetical protein
MSLLSVPEYSVLCFLNPGLPVSVMPTATGGKGVGHLRNSGTTLRPYLSLSQGFYEIFFLKKSLFWYLKKSSNRNLLKNSENDR